MYCLGPEMEILHQRYAEALVETAEESGRLDKVENDLDFLNTAIRKDGRLTKVLYHPEVARADKLGLLEEIASKADFCDESLSFIKLLVEKNRLKLIHGVFLRYRDIYDRRKKRQKVFVKTAAPLSKTYIERLKRILDKVLDKDIIIEERTDPSLIGGLNMRIGDRVYNLSLADKLKFIEERLAV